MTTTAANPNTDTPLSDYFIMDPLLGSADPFAAWDADLHPEEYGDQSGYAPSWDDDDHASFSDDDDDDAHSLSSCEGEADDDWNIVYAASFTVVASTTAAASPKKSGNAMPRKSKSLPTLATPTPADLSATSTPPSIPQPCSMTRRDSKVRFSEQPPQVNCYESCVSRDEYSQLWFSVHELQKNICELRLESKNGTASASSKSVSKAAVTITPARSA